MPRPINPFPFPIPIYIARNHGKNILCKRVFMSLGNGLLNNSALAVSEHWFDNFIGRASAYISGVSAWATAATQKSVIWDNFVHSFRIERLRTPFVSCLIGISASRVPATTTDSHAKLQPQHSNKKSNSGNTSNNYNCCLKKNSQKKSRLPASAGPFLPSGHLPFMPHAMLQVQKSQKKLAKICWEKEGALRGCSQHTKQTTCLPKC